MPSDARLCLAMYEQMLTIRRFEETAIALFERGHIRGNVHPCIGQEAVSVGVCASLRRDDYMTSTHRGHGNCLAKGADPRLMMAELLTCLGIVGNIDQDAVDDWVKRYGTKAQREAFMATLASLPKGRAWFWSPAWLGCFTQVDVRKKLTFDSSKTPSAGESIEKPVHLAKPDLDKLTKQITATIERAKAEDPRELKHRITELERQLKSGSAVTKPCNHESIIEKLRTHESELISEVKRLDVDCKRLKGDHRAIDQGLETIIDKLQKMQGAVKHAGEIESGKSLALHPLQSPPRVPARTIPVGTISGKSANHKPVESDGDITRPQQRIIDALARLEGIGVIPADKVTVAVQAGVSNKSSAYTNNLGALRTAGLVDYPFSGAVALTDAGREVADPGDSINSLNEYHRQWLSMITRPQAAILGELIRIYPEPIDKVELAARIVVSDLSSAYTNNLGALRTMGAITYPQRGTVAATALLFPEGLVGKENTGGVELIAMHAKRSWENQY